MKKITRKQKKLLYETKEKFLLEKKTNKKSLKIDMREISVAKKTAIVIAKLKHFVKPKRIIISNLSELEKIRDQVALKNNTFSLCFYILDKISFDFPDQETLFLTYNTIFCNNNRNELPILLNLLYKNFYNFKNSLYFYENTKTLTFSFFFISINL